MNLKRSKMFILASIFAASCALEPACQAISLKTIYAKVAMVTTPVIKRITLKNASLVLGGAALLGTGVGLMLFCAPSFCLSQFMSGMIISLGQKLGWQGIGDFFKTKEKKKK